MKKKIKTAIVAKAKKDLDTRENGLESAFNFLFNNSNFGALFKGAPINNQMATYYNTKLTSITLDRLTLMNRYTTDGIVQDVVEKPVIDACKGELTINTSDLDTQEIEQLKRYLENYNIMETVKQALIWDRLFGGAGIIIEVENQDLSEKFSINDIYQGEKVHFTAADRWELAGNSTTGQIDNGITIYTNFNYYGKIVDNSRVIMLKGRPAPSILRSMLNGWGLSCVEPLIAPLNGLEKVRNLIYELMDEAKIDVYKIYGLNEAAAAKQDEAIRRRVSIAQQNKNFMRAITLDNEDDFIQKQLNLSGVSDILQQQRLEIACASKIPLTKLYGLSSAGFNSGDDDIENYNTWVEGEVRYKLYTVLKKVICVICKSMFGIVPSDLNISLPDLKVPKPQDIETRRLNDFKIGLDYFLQDQFTSQEFAEYCKDKDLIVMDTKAIKGELPEFASAMYQEDTLNL